MRPLLALAALLLAGMSFPAGRNPPSDDQSSPPPPPPPQYPHNGRDPPLDKFKEPVLPVLPVSAAGAAPTDAAAATHHVHGGIITNATLWSCLDASGVAVERHPVDVPLPRGAAVWNRLYSDSIPLGVAQPRSTAEVAAAVRCARAAGVQVGSVGGGVEGEGPRAAAIRAEAEPASAAEPNPTLKCLGM